MRLCRGFGVFGWEVLLSLSTFYSCIKAGEEAKENQGFTEAGQFDRIRDYLSSSYVPNLAGIPDTLLVFGFKQPLEKVWSAEGVVPTAMADAR